ncbi:MAG: hypothetical protein K2W92_05590 [Alphaproteobacteria bacterium]|nr:hypothetical protein [Alphaproteobacteria bacterium]
MKPFWFLIMCLFIECAKAQVITVADVKVSVTDDSAAVARDKALDQAHSLAFQKLLKENFPEESRNSPSTDIIMNMVTDFSIDREKTTPKSYTASFTFQFDASQLLGWVTHKGEASSQNSLFTPQVLAKGKSLKLRALYSTLSEWQVIKKALENFAEVQKLIVLTFTPQHAELDVVYAGNIEKLQQHLVQKGVLLSFEAEEWILSLEKQRL